MCANARRSREADCARRSSPLKPKRCVQKGDSVINCEFRLISEDVLLERREVETLPQVGDEVLLSGEAYVVAAPPSDIVAQAATVYVRKAL